MNVLVFLPLAVLFYLIPIILGRAFFLFVHQIRTVFFQKKDHFSGLSSLTQLSHLLTQRFALTKERQTVPAVTAFSWFAAGTVIILVFASAIQFFCNSLGLTKTFPLLFYPFIYTLTFVSGCIQLFSLRPHRLLSWKAIRSGLVVLLVAVICSLAVWQIWTYRSPYPLNWDLYQHQTLTNILLRDHFDFWTANLSDTFGFASYPPTFHLLLSLSQAGLVNSATMIVDYWQAVTFLHLLSVALLSYYLGMTVTRKPLIGWLSLLIGTLSFDSIISFTNLFFLPQSVAAVLGIGLLTVLFAKSEHKAQMPHWLSVGLGMIALISFHFVIGMMAAGMYGVTWLYFRFYRTWHKAFTHLPILEILCLVVIAGMIGSYFLDLGFINRGEAASYLFSLSEKQVFIQRVYGYGLYLLLPLGLLAGIRTKYKTQKYVLFLTICFIALLLSHLPYVFKFMVLARFFFHLLMAAGLWLLISKIHWRILRMSTVAIITTGLLAILILNSFTWKQGLAFNTYNTHLSTEDLEAADFLRKLYPPTTTLLISDPASQFILEGLCGINSAGGAYVTPEFRKSLYTALTTTEPSQQKSSLLAITDPLQPNPKHRLLVLSGRTFVWAEAKEADRMAFDYNIWSPKYLSLENMKKIDELKKSLNLKPLFSSPVLMIFEM